MAPIKLTKRNSAMIEGQLWHFKTSKHWASDRVARGGGYSKSTVVATRISDGKTVEGSSRENLEKVIARRITEGIY